MRPDRPAAPTGARHPCEAGHGLQDAPRSRHGLLEAGRNCDTIRHAGRFTALVDGAAYFRTLRAALCRARHSVFIVGWDIDSRLQLVPDGANDGFPEPLAPFLQALTLARRELRVHVLAWDFAMIYALERESPFAPGVGWFRHAGIEFRLDDTHPPSASHHQKMVVIDDRLAFVGGLDLTSARWDDCAHDAANPLRRGPDGAPYGPFHDIQAMFDGDAAAAIGALVRRRWQRAHGEPHADGGPAAAPTSSAPGDPWPAGVPVDVTDVRLGIVLTAPRHGAQPALGQTAALVDDAIRAARHHLYIENQYFTAAVVRDSLRARLARPDAPDVTVIVPRVQSGWLQEATMGVLRARLHASLREADRHDRYRLLYPHADGLGERCINVHSKLLIVDDECLLIGSANFNNRSMLLDTECGVALVAAGEPRVGAAIAKLRERLLAEHLGTTVEAVAQALASGARPNAAIDRLRRPHGRTLLPLEPVNSPALDALIPVSAVFDPEKPIEPTRVVAEVVPPHRRRSLAARFLAPGLAVLAITALTLFWRYSPLGQQVSIASLSHAALRIAAYPFAPLVIVAAYVVAAALSVPITLLITVTGLVFGAWPGFAYAAVSTLLSAAATYAAGAWLGHDAIHRYAGDRARRVSEQLGEHGIVAMIVLRLLPVAPFTAVNLVAGASHISLRDYLIGTALGMLPGIALTVAFAHQLSAALRHPNAAAFAWLIGIGIALVAVSALLIRAVRRWR
ncbi:VTT domain-containing protein [Burkholderia plantarii]|uniref:VTT domain-containing protein n=1 Tax=Burkholderia plantarii TaxID=41899 RepID=UPI001F5BEAFB|nr:VTT domain-containing protein [Burkholderia plantarii]